MRSQHWKERFSRARERDQAVRAVRREGRNGDREHLRETLERELAKRGLTESPLWIETTLDFVERPAAPVSHVAEGLQRLADAIGRLGEGTGMPVAVLPPPRAFLHEMRVDAERWVAVDLDPEARCCARPRGAADDREPFAAAVIELIHVPSRRPGS
jgi:hypothetical protein